MLEESRKRFQAALARDPGGLGIDLLRVGMGVVWGLDLVFIIDPNNDFFGSFRDLALSFASTTVGGSALSEFAAVHATTLAWVVAVLTAYLAFAFLSGVSVRFACLAGFIFNGSLLLTQWGNTFAMPGGTDVGPQPVYMLIDVVILVVGAGRYLSLQDWLSVHRRALARPHRPSL